MPVSFASFSALALRAFKGLHSSPHCSLLAGELFLKKTGMKLKDFYLSFVDVRITTKRYAEYLGESGGRGESSLVGEIVIFTIDFSGSLRHGYDAVVTLA